jgi:hypothetical protein
MKNPMRRRDWRFKEVKLGRRQAGATLMETLIGLTLSMVVTAGMVMARQLLGQRTLLLRQCPLRRHWKICGAGW